MAVQCKITKTAVHHEYVKWQYNAKITETAVQYKIEETAAQYKND
jgi:hypothetical protein